LAAGEGDQGKQSHRGGEKVDDGEGKRVYLYNVCLVVLLHRRNWDGS